MGKTSDPDPNTYRFGKLIKSLRKVRGLTQEQLAERSGLSPDTIRRAEHASFSPSLTTISKIARGLDLQLSTLFSALDLGELDLGRELALALVVRRRMSQRERVVALRVLGYLLAIIREVSDDG